MKKLSIFLAVAASLVASSPIFAIGCNANSPCSFSIPVNTLMPVNLNQIAKGKQYNCKISGLASLGAVDKEHAQNEGITDINFTPHGFGYDIDASFNTTGLKTTSGDINFNLICGPGDTTCVTTIKCLA